MFTHSGEENNNNKGNLKKPMRRCISAFLSIKKKIIPYLVFSLFWGENILADSRRKYLSPTIYFPSFLPTKHTSKKFSFLFSL